jgi:hypothetical protein
VRALGCAERPLWAPCNPLPALQLANARGDARAEDVFDQFDKTGARADLLGGIRSRVRGARTVGKMDSTAFSASQIGPGRLRN